MERERWDDVAVTAGRWGAGGWCSHHLTGEVYLDHSVDESLRRAPYRLLDAGEEAQVGARQVLGAVDDELVDGALSLHGHACRQQQVPDTTEQAGACCWKRWALTLTGYVMWRSDAASIYDCDKTISDNQMTSKLIGLKIMTVFSRL